MKRHLSLLYIMLALVVCACTKQTTATSERHVLFDEAIPLGQHVEDFFKDFQKYSVSLEVGTADNWRLDVYSDKAYFTFAEDGEDLFQYMADLYNDTVYCFCMPHEYPYGEDDMVLLRKNCDTILWDNDESLAARYYLPGRYRDIVIDQDGWLDSFTDSVGIARYNAIK